MSDASSFTSGSPSNKGLIDFDVTIRADLVALWPYHGGSQLVKYLESRFVAIDPQLTLELKSR
jgi:hypothetical protein